jgi:hypothetical protein
MHHLRHSTHAFAAVASTLPGALIPLQTVRNILREAYGDKSAVNDELVEVILKPGLEPGAVRVFLDFISYSGGPVSNPGECCMLDGSAASLVGGPPILCTCSSLLQHISSGNKAGRQRLCHECLAHAVEAAGERRIGMRMQAVFKFTCAPLPNLYMCAARLPNPAPPLLVPAQLPEDLISSTTRPVSIIWGEADPWEDVKLGKKLFASLPPVVEWITLPGGCIVYSAAAQVHRDCTCSFIAWHGMADSWGALETHNPA